MPVIRTPDERFQNLPDFPYQPRSVEVNGLLIHYLDEGQGEVILCLHGEPSWSYLYRKMIPILSRNHRVLAMDFILETSQWVKALCAGENSRPVHLICQSGL